MSDSVKTVYAVKVKDVKLHWLINSVSLLPLQLSCQEKVELYVSFLKRILLQMLLLYFMVWCGQL